MSGSILSLDLSLRGAGMIVLPLAWGGDWSKVLHQTYGEKLDKDATHQMKIGRIVRIAAEVLALAEMFRPDHVFVEHYAYNAHPNMDLGELGGVVKHQLATRLGLIARPVVASSARKVLMGTLPRKGAKDATHEYLNRIGVPLEWTNDERDAFVVANYGASELGGFAFAAAPIERRKGKAA